eukprot:sb/3474283/
MVCNKAGAVRVSRSYTTKSLPEPRGVLHSCLKRNSPQQCCHFVLKDHKVRIVFRQYASLFFILGISEGDNIMAYFAFIHNLVETLNSYFSNVCELDLMHNVDRAHMILDEIVVNGYITESNRSRVLAPIAILDKSIDKV